MVIANNATIVVSKEAIAKILGENTIWQLNNPKFVVLQTEKEVKKLEREIKFSTNPVSILKL